MPRYGENWDGETWVCVVPSCEYNKKEAKPLREHKVALGHYEAAVKRIHSKPRHLWHDEDQQRIRKGVN
jgi:hypothetical protein